MHEAVPINCSKEALIVSLSQASVECTILVKINAPSWCIY